MNVKQIIGIFLIPRGITLSQIALSYPKHSLTKIFYITHFISLCATYAKKKKERKIANNRNLFQCKVQNFVKNCSIVPKTDIDLDILMINMNTKFYCSMSNLGERNKRKLLVDRPTNRQT